MKLKKFLTSKPFLLGALVVLCVGILAVCLVVNRDKGSEFTPEPPASTAPIESWEETSSTLPTAPTDGAGVDAAPRSKTPEEAFPQVTDETDQKTVVAFTDPEPEKPEAPPAPEGKTVKEDPGPEHPVNTDPTVTPPPAPEPAQPSGPQSGDQNNQGQVYVPGFGWITPSTVEQSTIDSDGDPNKMVGQMGGD